MARREKEGEERGMNDLHGIGGAGLCRSTSAPVVPHGSIRDQSEQHTAVCQQPIGSAGTNQPVRDSKACRISRSYYCIKPDEPLGHLPVVRDRGGAVEVGPRQRAPLDPEGLHGVERRAVELLKALVVGHQHVPLDNGDRAEGAKLGANGLIQKQLVELHRRAFRVGVLLSSSKIVKNGGFWGGGGIRTVPSSFERKNME